MEKEEKKLVVPGRTDGRLSQVSHIALTCVPVPFNIKLLKGCEFNPPFTLNRNTLYLIVISNKAIYFPQPGWYNVPEKRYITWIERFTVKGKSKPFHLNPTLFNQAWVFEAHEGLPPVDAVVPDMSLLPKDYFTQS